MFFGFFLLLLVFGVLHQVGKRMRRRFWRHKIKGKKVVAVIRISGPIRPPASDEFFDKSVNWKTYESAFKKALTLPNLRTICLEINCPGGSPVQSSLFFKNVTQMLAKHNGEVEAENENDDNSVTADEKKKRKVDLVAVCEDVAASGGYYLACAAPTIIADESSLVGSIGVRLDSFGMDKVLNRWQVDRRMYTSVPNKAMLDPFSPIVPEHEEHTMNIIRNMHESFVNVVKASRGDKISADVEQEVFSGAVWDGKTALELGLIDAIGEKNSYFEQKYGNKLMFIKCKATNNPWERWMNRHEDYDEHGMGMGMSLYNWVFGSDTRNAQAEIMERFATTLVDTALEKFSAELGHAGQLTKYKLE